MIGVQSGLLSQPNPGFSIPYAALFDGDADFLVRTPGAAGNRDRWTLSFWVKVWGGEDTTRAVLTAGTTNNDRDWVGFGNNLGGSDNLNGFEWYENVGGASVAQRGTSAMFRDPSAWTHFVLVYDSAASVAADRLTIYLNGVQVADFDHSANPTQNQDSQINNNVLHRIGRRSDTTADPADVYLAEVVFIDGSALDATSFGEFSDAGFWRAKRIAGLTYGTNGYYLDFSNASDLGEDQSGNNNDWTVNGAPVRVTDTPTDNHMIMSAVDNGGTTVSEGGLKIAGGSSTPCRSTFAIPLSQSNGIYIEMKATALNDNMFCGVEQSNDVMTAPGSLTDNAIVAHKRGAGGSNKWNYDEKVAGSGTTNNAFTGDPTAAVDDYIQIAIKNGKVWLGINNTWQGDPAAGTGALADFSAQDIPSLVVNAEGQTSGTWEINFGQKAYNYTAPTGFGAANTSRLPSAPIENPSLYFQSILYTGTGATKTVNQDGNADFSPDLIVFKCRNATETWRAVDTERGTTKALQPDNTAGEVTESGVTAFNSDGFTLGSAGSGYNTLSNTYVAHMLKAASLAGIDVIKYTGNGTAGRTVAHGLGVAPDWVIIKELTVRNWVVWCSPFGTAGNSDYLMFDISQAKGGPGAINVWNSTVPDASNITLGDNANTNENSIEYIGYVFRSVPGFSLFGSYDGNGSADGPYVHCGFRPAFVILKASSGAGSWYSFDRKRDTENPAENQLIGDTNAAESDVVTLDFTADGFKLRTASTERNGSGVVHQFAAFAHAPFGGANVPPALAA